MKPINCILNCYSNTDHLSQLYTGFGLLESVGKINLSYAKSENYKTNGKQLLTVLIDNSHRIAYDVNDHDRIYEEELLRCDLYFKRSYDREKHETLSYKIEPLGLNYPVYGNYDRAITRALWGVAEEGSATFRQRVIGVIRSSRILATVFRDQNAGRHLFRIESFEGAPILNPSPLVLFLARAWDPSRVIGRSPERADEWASINRQRAECVRALRREFGRQFIGGLAPDEFAVKNFSDCVVERRLTRKDRYLKTVRDADICIATSGLDRSIGWKFAEYVANAKAIVSEPLNYEVPGDLSAGKNYLCFRSTDECVDSVVTLFNDPTLRYEMMCANQLYYYSYVRPDVLVWNTLKKLSRVD